MNYARIACISLAVSVLLGSVGAHAIKPHLTAEALNSWETAVKYQVYQSLGLLIIALGGRVTSVQPLLHAWAKNLLALGILCFCGSLYLRSSSALTGMEFAWLGPVAPVGGILFMAGWVLAGFSFTSGK
jgi:uncharacterized membrane protein YgdD (TMEM256/DUF423 family)